MFYSHSFMFGWWAVRLNRFKKWNGIDWNHIMFPFLIVLSFSIRIDECVCVRKREGKPIVRSIVRNRKHCKFSYFDIFVVCCLCTSKIYYGLYFMIHTVVLYLSKKMKSQCVYQNRWNCKRKHPKKYINMKKSEIYFNKNHCSLLYNTNIFDDHDDDQLCTACRMHSPLEKWCEKWNVKFTPSNTHCILYTVLFPFFILPLFWWC